MVGFFKLNRRVIVVLFGLLLAVAQIGFLPQGEVYAAVGEETSVLAFTCSSVISG